MKKFLILLSLALLFIPASVHAVDFQALTGIPGIKEAGSSQNLGTLINNLYRIAIGIAGVIAVLQIIKGGITYMLGDGVTEKREATHHIRMSVLGLFLVLSPYLVFSIIDPRIVNNLNIDLSVLTPPAPTPGGTAVDRCANIKVGQIINSSYKDCCAKNNLYAHETRGGSITCEIQPPLDLGKPGDRGTDGPNSYFYNVPVTQGSHGILLLTLGSGAKCVTVKYAVFPDEATCREKLRTINTQGSTVLASCEAEALSQSGFRRVSASVEFCPTIQGL